MIRITKLLLCILAMFAASRLLAGNDQTPDNTKVAELTEDWLYYDHNFKTYFPYTDPERQVKAISQLVDLDKYRSYNLNFVSPPGLSLFINEKLFYENSSGKRQMVKIRVSDLNYESKGEKELLTFYQPDGELPLDDFFIGHTVSEEITSDILSQSARILPRDTTSREDVYFIAFLSILAILALLRNRYPKKFHEFSQFHNIIPSMDEDIMYDLSSIPVLLFVLINSLCSALILFLIYEQFQLYTLDFLNIFHDSPVLGISVVSVGFFLIFIGKYIYLKILGWIFNLSELVKIQFFELMKVSFKINLFLAVLTIIFYCSSYFHVQLNFDYFFFFTVISLLIVLMRVGYLAFKLSGFRNIYLFSYLCTTEILPLVIIVKMILF